MADPQRHIASAFANCEAREADWPQIWPIIHDVITEQHVSFIDSDMAAAISAPKISPQSVAQQAFDAVEAGQVDLLADERSRQIKAALSRDQELIYPDVRSFWDSRVKGAGSRLPGLPTARPFRSPYASR